MNAKQRKQRRKQVGEWLAQIRAAAIVLLLLLVLLCVPFHSSDARAAKGNFILVLLAMSVPAFLLHRSTARLHWSWKDLTQS